VYFESLADYRPLSRAARGAEAARIMQLYADRLERYCRLQPYNWFNFHDVWHDPA
jgi:predicted LPLAT superfamily acyltransferase